MMCGDIAGAMQEGCFYLRDTLVEVAGRCLCVKGRVATRALLRELWLLFLVQPRCLQVAAMRLAQRHAGVVAAVVERVGVHGSGACSLLPHRGEMRGRHTLKSSLFGGTNGEWKRPLADQAAVVEEAALWLGWGPQHGRGMRHGEGPYRVHGTTD